MRKNLLFVLLLTSFASFATEVSLEWVSPLLSSSASGNPQTQILDVRSDEHGDAFVLAKFGSLSASDETTFLNTSFTGAEYGAGASSNDNLLFSKVDKRGNLLWTVHSDEGFFKEGVFCPTADGGAVLAVKFRLTQKNLVNGQESPYMTLVDAAGNAHTLTTRYEDTNSYHIVFVHVGADGTVSGMEPLWTSRAVAPANTKNEPATDVASVNAVAVDDEGNIYFAGQQAMDIALGTDTLRARPCTGWTGDPQDLYKYATAFLLKTDPQFRHLGHIRTETGAQADRFERMACRNGRLMVVGSAIAATDNSGLAIQLGEIKTSLTGPSVTVAILDKNLNAECFSATSKTGTGGKLLSLAWSPDGRYAYLVGSVQGGITVMDRLLDGANAVNDGMLLKIDASTGVAVGAVLAGNTTNNLYTGVVVAGNDTLLVLGYALDGTISLITCSPALALLDQSQVASQKGAMASSSGMARVGDTLWMAFRAAQNIDFQVGDTVLNHSTRWYASLSAWTIFDVSSALHDPADGPAAKVQKIMMDGKLFIRRGNRLFNVLGQQM